MMAGSRVRAGDGSNLYWWWLGQQQQKDRIMKKNIWMIMAIMGIMRPSVLCWMVALAAGSLAHADLLMYDGFPAGGSGPSADQYQSEPTTTDGSNNNSIDGQAPLLAGFTNTLAWSLSSPHAQIYGAVVEPGLNYIDSFGNSLVTTQGHLQFTNSYGSYGSGRNATRSTILPGPMTDYTPTTVGVYISVLMQFNQEALLYNNNKFLETSISQAGRKFKFGLETNANGQAVAYIVNETNLGSKPHNVTKVVTPDTPVFMVVHIYESDQIEIWINPPDLTDETVGRDYSGADLGAGYVGDNSSYGLDSVAVRFNSYSDAGASFMVDEIRVGTTWADAVPFLPSPPKGTVIMIR